MNFSDISKKKLYLFIGGVGVVLVAGFGANRILGTTINVASINEAANNTKTRSGLNLVISALTGEQCAGGQSRPVAVMISSDKEARPLSGIGEADWVFEMPVVENGFTRMMAVFQCGRPKEVGSVRSSRLDFVPLAQGINAIYAHFGGEHSVLEELNAGVINNIDGLKYDGTYYYRKSGIPRPHNAFTDFDRINEVSAKLGYNLTDAKVSYLHEKQSVSLGDIQPPLIFNEGFKVQWRYDKVTNGYLRTRSDLPELDKNTNKPVMAQNVVILKTTWSPINKDYIRVKIVGAGGLLLYKNGTVVTGTWEKANDQAKLYFYDQNHKEIELAVGKVWVEIDAR